MSNLPSRLPHHSTMSPLKQLGRWKSEAWPIPEEFQAHKYHVQTHGTGMTGLLDAFFYQKYADDLLIESGFKWKFRTRHQKSQRLRCKGHVATRDMCCVLVLLIFVLFIHLFDKAILG